MDVSEKVIKATYGRYTDEELKNEYIAFRSIYDIDIVYNTQLIEYLDELQPLLLEEIAQRFIQTSGNNVIYLKQNNGQ